MPNGAGSSSGGAGGATGSGFEARVIAWLAAHLLAREALPPDWRINAAKLDQVGGQTGLAIDDVGAITERGGFILIQAKHRLNLRSSSTSGLADAVDQVVRQFLDGVPDGDGGCRRAEAGRDLLVICTDSAGSSRVSRDLACVVERLATHPDEFPLEQAAKNDNQRMALETLRGHLDASFSRYMDGTSASDHQVREIAKVLHVAALKLDEGQTDRDRAEMHLRGALDDPEMVGGAWNDLTALGQALIERQQWADRTAIQNALEAGGHPTGIDPPYRTDVARLREVTTAILETSSQELAVVAPDAVVSVRREVADQLLEVEGGFALIGDAGAGKSVLAIGFAAQRLDAGEDVLFLPAESLAGSLSATTAELDLEHNLDRVLRGWNGGQPATLIVDGIDATRGSTAVDWLPALTRSLKGTRWRVVGTVRSFDLRHSNAWQEMFPGEPVDPAHADVGFPRVRHLLVGHLTEGEMRQVADQSPLLAALLDAAEPRLRDLLRNPLNLRLAAQLLDSNADEVAAVRTRQDLLHLYWRRRVENAPEHLARRHALRDLCEAMLTQRRARVADPSTVVNAAVLGAVEALLHDGVLREDVQGRHATTSPVAFSHPVLFDFAVAVMCLNGNDQNRLARRLDSDADLAITIRPSLDMYLADRWEADPSRAAYWELVVSLSEPRDGHPIAAIAAACTALREHPTYAELACLEALALAATGNSGARMGVAYLAGALEADEVSIADRQASAPALAALAGSLAAGAATAFDLGLANLARVLLLRLDRCFPLQPGAIGADVRARATADVMRTALVNPKDPEHERLALCIGDPLTRAAAVDPVVVTPVVEQTIAVETMSAWGGNVVAQQVRALASLAASDPGFARRLAFAPWSFDAAGDEATPIGSSQIMALTTTRRQELEMARFGTGQAFPGFLVAAPESAVRFFLDVIAIHGAPHEAPRSTGGLPRVYWSGDLQFAGGHDALNEMARALVAFLTQQLTTTDGVTRADALLELLVRELSHDQVWRYLLDAGASTPSIVGRRLVPVLLDGDLLGHSFTHPSAARLIAAVSPLVEADEHAALERAVFAARDPVNENEETNRTLVDTLLGQLDRGKLQLEESRIRLDELDQAGGAPAPPENPLTFHPWGDFAPEPEPDGDVSTPFRLMLDQVRADVGDSSTGSADDQRAARERLRVSVPALVSLLEGPNGPIDPSELTTALAYLLPGAERLASDETVLPGTQLGNVVLGLFAAASPGDGALEQDEAP
jgi:hypothetical protein